MRLTGQLTGESVESPREDFLGAGMGWAAGRSGLLHQQVDSSGWVASGSCCQGGHYALWLGWHLGIMACTACTAPIFLSLPPPSTLILFFHDFSLTDSSHSNSVSWVLGFWLLEFAAWYVNNESCILQNGSSSGSTFQRGYGIFFFFFFSPQFSQFFFRIKFWRVKQASKQASKQAGRQAGKQGTVSQPASKVGMEDSQPGSKHASTQARKEATNSQQASKGRVGGVK